MGLLDKIIPVPEFEEMMGISAQPEIILEAMTDFHWRRKWDHRLKKMDNDPERPDFYTLTRSAPLLGTMVSTLEIRRSGEGWEFHEKATRKPLWLKQWNYDGLLVPLRNSSRVTIKMVVEGAPLFVRRVWGAFFTDYTARALVLLKNTCENKARNISGLARKH